ncbi:putative transport permease YvfS [Arthrobacter sp. Hiyo8]|uniref:ABC transporter permease n=1 Tax=unclassified Arthrobacter TaxID=235627 RepID=UPI0006839B76|nr:MULTISPECIES: ABC transporter permease [unclassified Arthrobacter]BAS13201.1 putative transport permease YvfS [Arthrobacter sp. Hiyo8]GAP58187.1 putative transport permease YvfS [Arthrobacter sp. Hiyo1]
MSAATVLQERKASSGGVNSTFLWIEIKRMLRNRRTIMFTVFMPAVFFFIFGLSNKDKLLPNGHSYGQYILISLTVYAAMTAATGAGSQVAVERAQGWSRQLRLTPLLPGAYIAVKAMAALTLSLVAVVAQFVIGALAGVTMDAQTWLTAGLVAWLGSLVFAALGLFVGYLMPSQNVMQILGPALAILAMLGGLFMPIEIMGETFGNIAKFTPAYGIGQLARSPITGEFDWAWIVNVLIWLAIFVAGAAMAFRRDTKRV